MDYTGIFTGISDTNFDRSFMLSSEPNEVVSDEVPCDPTTMPEILLSLDVPWDPVLGRTIA
jgi:hypothetical protein